MTFLCHCQQIPKHSFGAKLRALNEEKKIFMGIRIPEIWQILEIFTVKLLLINYLHIIIYFLGNKRETDLISG